MPEYFIRIISNPAPFVGDEYFGFREAESPAAALMEAAEEYEHPFGLHSVAVYESALDYHKGAKPLAWRPM